MLNRNEKIEKSLQKHYVLGDNVFNEIKTFVKEHLSKESKNKELKTINSNLKKCL